MTQPRPNSFQTSDPRFISPSTVDRLRIRRGLSNADTIQKLEEIRTNLSQKLLTGYSNIGEAIGDGIEAITLALTGAPGGLDALQEWAQAVLQDVALAGDVIEVLTGKPDGNQSDLGSWVSRLLGRDVSLAARVARIEGKIAAGAEFFDDFARGDNDTTLGNGWVQGGTGQGLGIKDQAAQLKPDLFPALGRRWARTPSPASGDDFTVAAVIHPAGTTIFATMSLFARCTDGLTEGVAVNLTGNSTKLVRFTRTAGSGSNFTFTELASSGKAYSNSATIEFTGTGNNYKVLIDSNVVIDWTGASGVAVDASHRYAGFALEVTAGIPAQFSGCPASFALRSSATLPAVQATAAAAVTPVAQAITAGATGQAPPATADTTVYDATKSLTDTAVGAQQQATTVAIQLQQQQQNNSVGAGGVNKLLQFSGSTVSTTDWSYQAGRWRVVSNQMTLNNDQNSALNVHYLARANYQFATDDQSIIAQLGTEQQNNDQGLFLCLRANGTGLQGMACRVTANSIAVGAYAMAADGSASPGFTPAQQIGIGVAVTNTIEFRAVGNTYTVLLNSQIVLTFSSSIGSTGSAWRNAAVMMLRANSFFIDYYSFRLTSFGMIDYGSAGNAVTNRTAARVSRIAANNVSLVIANGTSGAFPANFFGSSDFAQGMQVQTLGTGEIKAAQAGWYDVLCSFTSVMTQAGDPGGTSAAVPSHWCLIVNGVRVTHGIPAGVSIKWPLAANDVVAPGIFVNQFHSRANINDTTLIRPWPMAQALILGGAGSFFQLVIDA